jgi:hypothetical protein
MSFFITERFVNNNYSYYVLKIESSQNLEEVFDNDFINTVEYIYHNNKEMPEGWKKVSIADIDYKSMIEDIKIEGNNIYIRYKYFPSIVRTSNGTVNEGSARVCKYVTTVLKYLDSDILVHDGAIISGYINSYIFSIIVSASSILLLLIVIIIVTIFNKKEAINSFILYILKYTGFK